jgi:hypothetical protein
MDPAGRQNRDVEDLMARTEDVDFAWHVFLRDAGGAVTESRHCSETRVRHDGQDETVKSSL